MSVAMPRVDEARPRFPLTRLMALAIGNLIIGSNSTCLIGMLRSVSADLGVSPSQAGQLITAYGLAACVCGPVLGGLTSRLQRRSLLVGILLGCTLINLASALAPGYWTLMLCRILLAGVGVLFTSQAAVTASLLVSPQQRGQAMSLAFLGMALATVLGMPLGAWLGSVVGWRVTLALLGLASLLVALAVRWVLPGGLQVAPVNREGWVQIWRHPTLLRVLGVSVLQFSGQSTLSAYVAVWLALVLHLAPADLGWMLVGLGVFGVLGNILGSRLIDRVGPVRVVHVTLSGLMLAFAFWPAGQWAWPLSWLAIALWGSFIFVTNSAQQVRLLTLAPALAPVSVSLNSSAIYLGQAVGAAVGGLAQVWGALPWLSWVGLPFFVAALALSGWTQRQAPPVKPAGVA